MDTLDNREDRLPTLGGETPYPTSGHEGYTLAAVSERTGKSVKTLRRLIRTGALPAVKVAGPYGEEYRIAGDTLDRLGKDPGHGQGGSLPTPGHEPGRDPGQAAPPPAATLPDPELQWRAAVEREAALRHELAATQAEQNALKVEVAAVRAERDAVRGERDFIRERLVAAETAATEQRVLALRASEALAVFQATLPTVEAPQALPGPEAPPRRPWWRLWGA